MRKLAGLMLSGVLLGGCGAEAASTVGGPSVEDPKVTLGRTIDAVMRGNYAFSLGSNGYVIHAAVALPDAAEAEEWPKEAEYWRGVFGYRYIGADRYVRMPAEAAEGLPDERELAGLIAQGDDGRKKAESLRAIARAFDGKHWIRLGPRTGGGDRYDLYHVPDGPGVAAILTAVKSAERHGNEITGVLDLTAAAPADTLPWTSKDITDMGASGASIPFTAGLALNGLVTRLVVQVPDHGMTKAGAWVISLSRYGMVKPPEAPAKSQLIELPSR